MKVLLVTENFIKGGLDSFIVTLLNYWPRDSDEITLLVNDSHAGIATYQSQIKRKFTLSCHKWSFFAVIEKQIPRRWWRKPLIPFVKYILFTLNIFQFVFFYYKHKPDRILVVNGGYPAGDSCRAATIAGLFYQGRHSIYLNLHNTAAPPHFLLKPFEHLTDYFVGLSSKKILVVSKAVASSLSCRPALNRWPLFHVIYNGVIKHDTNGPTAKDLCNWPDAKNYLLLLCAYDLRKGHKFIIQVMEKVCTLHPDCHLVICGHGTQEDILAVQHFIPSSLQNRIHSLPFTASPGCLLRDATILLSGSQEFESFGLTILEAALFGVPAVVTDVGGQPEIVKNGITGYVVPKDDVDGFASAVDRLLINKQLYKIISNDAKVWAQTFTPQRMSQEYMQALDLHE